MVRTVFWGLYDEKERRRRGYGGGCRMGDVLLCAKKQYQNGKEEYQEEKSGADSKNHVASL